MEHLSSTDMECSWKKAPASLQYDQAIPVKEFCHVATTAAPFVMEDSEAEELRAHVMEFFPDSQLSKHRYVYNFFPLNLRCHVTRAFL